MSRAYSSESDKVRDRADIMQYIKGDVIDIGCGGHCITEDAVGVDGRALPGVKIVTTSVYDLSDIVIDYDGVPNSYDTVFSSHFLEHLQKPYDAIFDWRLLLRRGGHLVLYLPDRASYDNYQNPEHYFNWSYEDFLFFFKRCFCGEGKDFEGNHLRAGFELVDSGFDVGPDKYSFYLIAKAV